MIASTGLEFAGEVGFLFIFLSIVGGQLQMTGTPL